MTHRIGFLASSGLVVVGIAYAIVVGFGMAEEGLTIPSSIQYLP